MSGKNDGADRAHTRWAVHFSGFCRMNWECLHLAGSAGYLEYLTIRILEMFNLLINNKKSVSGEASY